MTTLERRSHRLGAVRSYDARRDVPVQLGERWESRKETTMTYTIRPLDASTWDVFAELVEPTTGSSAALQLLWDVKRPARQRVNHLKCT